MVPAMTPRWTALDASGPGTGTRLGSARLVRRLLEFRDDSETDIRFGTRGGWADEYAEARHGTEGMRR